MTRAVKLESDAGLATLRLDREHGNAINGDLVESLIGACEQAATDPEIRAVTLAASGKLFCPGLDVQELIELDRAEMERFVARFNACILALYSFPKPLVAAIHGHAIAGGCVLALTTDWRVLREGAMVGLNELRVGVPFPYGVATILRESVGAHKLEEVALFGRNYEGRDAVGAGLVHEAVAPDEFEARCRERVEELAARDPEAFSISKRYLRGPALERIRRHEAERMHEFVDAWFSPPTRKRLSDMAAELERRK